MERKGGNLYVCLRTILERFSLVVDHPHCHDGLVFCHDAGHREGMMGWHGSRHITESAREILDKRYAAGEISKEEYEEKKKHISQ